MHSREVLNSSFKRGEIHLAAKDIYKKQAPIFYAPGCADAKIGKLGVLVCGVPALEDLVEPLRLFGSGVEFQPFPLDNDARGWLRILLVLRDKIVIRHRTTLDVE